MEGVKFWIGQEPYSVGPMAHQMVAALARLSMKIALSAWSNMGGSMAANNGKGRVYGQAYL
jgi:hypothetical protein